MIRPDAPASAGCILAAERAASGMCCCGFNRSCPTLHKPWG